MAAGAASPTRPTRARRRMSSPSPASEATQLLLRINQGDSQATERLLRLLYDELRALAAKNLRGERPDHTLQPTALVHEAWLKLVDSPGPEWEGRSHFLGIAARAMRQVLVDHVRRRRAEKRVAAFERVPLDEAVSAIEGSALDLLALDEALGRLAAHDAQLARLVELRFCGGLTVEETGRMLGLSVRQVEGAWITARAWLYRAMGASAAGTEAP